MYFTKGLCNIITFSLGVLSIYHSVLTIQLSHMPSATCGCVCTIHLSIVLLWGSGARDGDFDIFKMYGQNPHSRAHFDYRNHWVGTIYHVKIVWLA